MRPFKMEINLCSNAHICASCCLKKVKVRIKLDHRKHQNKNLEIFLLAADLALQYSGLLFYIQEFSEHLSICIKVKSNDCLRLDRTAELRTMNCPLLKGITLRS